MYKTPGAMEMALKARAQVAARALGVSTEDLLRRFHFQRLLTRVFLDVDWLLKGGQALLVRYPTHARYSRDIDLFRPKARDLTEAIAALRRATARDLGDFYTFSKTEPLAALTKRTD